MQYFHKIVESIYDMLAERIIQQIYEFKFNFQNIYEQKQKLNDPTLKKKIMNDLMTIIPKENFYTQGNAKKTMNQDDIDQIKQIIDKISISKPVVYSNLHGEHNQQGAYLLPFNNSEG